MTPTWSDADDAIIGGDLTAALAYLTPAGGAVATPVAPVGMRDRAAGTISFTTSLGFGRKLERIDADPRVALAYHAREHGFASEPRFVLVQGEASRDAAPDRAALRELRPATERFMGAPRSGPFWDRWLRVYRSDRVLVSVRVERVVAWPDLRCAGEREVSGSPLPGAEPPSQAVPAKGAGPRVDVQRALRRISALPHVLLAYRGSDGFPIVAPVSPAGSKREGIVLEGRVPSGARRASVLAHRYERQLIGLQTRLYTGWLDDGVFAPHTESGLRAPANKTLLLLANGFMARRGLRRARRAAAAS